MYDLVSIDLASIDLVSIDLVSIDLVYENPCPTRARGENSRRPAAAADANRGPPRLLSVGGIRRIALHSGLDRTWI